MPFETIPGTSDQFALLSFDLDGRERTDDPQGVGGRLSQEIVKRVANEQPSHILLFCHGWKGDVAAARDQYNRWIGAMLRLTDDRQAVKGTFKPIWIGLHWPSQPFGDEELSTESFDIGEGTLSPDEIKATYLKRLGLGDEAAPLIDTIIRDHQKNAAATELPEDSRRAYQPLASLAGHSSDGPPEGPRMRRTRRSIPTWPSIVERRVGRGQFGDAGFLGGILGPLRQLSYWTMKKRARTVGESGMHQFVSELMKAAPSTRSPGWDTASARSWCRRFSGRDGAGQLPRQVDSVALIQGAVSFTFGDSVKGKSRKGYFNPVHRPAVRGPCWCPGPSTIALSAHSTMGVRQSPSRTVPSIGRRICRSTALIGKYGSGACPARSSARCWEDRQLRFEAGKVYNLESSRFIARGGGLSGAHSDIDGPEVAHAIGRRRWCRGLR